MSGRHQRPRRGRPIAAAGIVERHDGCVLICRPDDGERRRWEFPCGLARDDESPEEAIRRIAWQRARLRLDIHVGQPPLMGQLGDREVEFRFFLCGLISGEGEALDYAEVRWVAKGQLCEYEFDLPSKGVVEWLVG